MRPLLIVLIRRYQGWDPQHDIGFFALGLLIAGATLWLHGEAMRPLFTPL